MKKELILGIDFSRDYSQLAYIDNSGNPQSISMGTKDNYLIPTAVCYNKDLDEWSAGEEAINKSRLENSTLYTDLPEMFTSGTDRELLEKITSAFMSYLIKLAVNYSNGRLIKNVLVTVNEVNPEISDGIMKVFTDHGYNGDDIRVISHSESFVYYVLNQNSDIWINKVYFLELNRHEFLLRKLDVVKGREPHVANVTVKDISDMLTLDVASKDMDYADNTLAKFLEEELKKNVVSGIYLSGEGFYLEGWHKTLSTICRNRRVFKGNNLIVKGAGYGAKENFLPPTLDRYLISCKGRTRVRVVMDVNYKDKDSTVTLSNIGEYWYQAKSKVECIMEKPTVAVFEVQDLINHTTESFKVDLRDFPEREPNTTRIEVKFRYITENKIEVQITDLGFGEFFESSGMSVKKEVVLSEL